jgi:hypothetical protein
MAAAGAAGAASVDGADRTSSTLGGGITMNNYYGTTSFLSLLFFGKYSPPFFRKFLPQE